MALLSLWIPPLLATLFGASAWEETLCKLQHLANLGPRAVRPWSDASLSARARHILGRLLGRRVVQTGADFVAHGGPPAGGTEHGRPAPRGGLEVVPRGARGPAGGTLGASCGRARETDARAHGARPGARGDRARGPAGRAPRRDHRPRSVRALRLVAARVPFGLLPALPGAPRGAGRLGASDRSNAAGGAS